MACHRTKTEYRLQNGLSTRSLSAQCQAKVPRPQSLKQHPESQSHFKKLPLAQILAVEFGEGKRLCQDETRLGLKTMGRLITATGVKPLGLSQWENFIYMAW